MVKINRHDLTQSILKEYLRYDDTSGEMVWIKNTHPTKNLIGRIAGGVSKRDSHKHIRLLGVLYVTHHLVWLYKTGKLPVGHIDHIDHNEQNNRFSNLREVTQAENNKNQSKRKDNTTGYVGGGYIKDRQAYKATISKDGKLHYLGYFKTFEEAKNARIEAEKKYYK